MKHLKSFETLGAIAAALAVLSLAAAKTSAQTPEIMAGWTTTSLAAGGGAPPASFAPTTSDPNLIIGPLNKGSGIGAITTANVYGGNDWTNAGVADSEANSIANGLYITYSVQASAGYKISFTTNVLYYHNSATGPWTGALQYSTDGVNYNDIASLAYSTMPNPSGVAATSSLTNNLSGIASLQNVGSSTINYFRIVNWGAYNTAGTWYINDSSSIPATTPDFQVIGYVTSAGVAPHNLVVSPSSITTNAGATVAFTVTANGDPPTYSWYQGSVAPANLLAGQTTATLTLNDVIEANAGSYYVVLSNATGRATSAPVSLTVTDPAILVQPANTFGLLDGTVQFSVSAAGTSLRYQWHYSDANGDVLAAVSPGAQSSGSIASGVAGSALALDNLQPADANNDPAWFVVVVTGYNGNTVTSSPAELISVNTSAMLAFWNFNGSAFNNSNPPPYIGVGAASLISLPPFVTTVEDPSDGAGLFFPFGQDLPNNSWGTSSYPVSGSNKMCGIQFNVSTVGAQNISVSYDSRVSSTASDYERLQYTSDGISWTDFPASSTFNGVYGSGNGGFQPFTNNLTGFPGADNNPNFGIRIVTEWQSTATYGISTNTNYLGTANNYTSGASGNFAAGTVTYDIVTIWGDAITNTFTPPTISGFANTNTPDYIPITLNFTVSDSTTPPDQLAYSAVSFSPTISFNAAFGGAGANRTLTISPFQTPDSVDTGPVLVTVTDGNGFSAATWFDLTLTSENLPPTNSLASLASTNTLANAPLAIPFKVADDRTPANGQSFTYSASSANNTVVPVANIVVPGQSQGSNATVTITPALNQLGMAQIGVTVDDNDLVDPKSTTATISFMVRPNTNIVLIDYFNYDNGGALDTVSSGFWNHLSGPKGQMQVSPASTGGYVTVDQADNTENLQAALLGSPYLTNSSAVLYSSFMVNMDPSGIRQDAGREWLLLCGLQRWIRHHRRLRMPRDCGHQWRSAGFLPARH